MATSDALWARSAGELADLIAAREVSAREVVDAHLERIEAVNPAVNAITLTLAESARAAADAIDGSAGSGPLRGVPFTIKENIDCAGSATTQGVPALKDAIPPIDAPVVERMKAAGAIPLARTNMPELGLRISTDNPLRGRTVNPWNPATTCGGSSGGEAAALATGMTPLGLGNDIGGSVRNPAFCCGTVALKPTPGRIPAASALEPRDSSLAAQLMLSDGPMARHIEDLIVAYQVLAGRHPRDARSVDVPLWATPPVRKRAALVTEVPGVSLPPGFKDAVTKAGAALADAGWAVEEASPPELERVHEVWGHVLSHDFSLMMDEFEAVMSKPATDLLRALIAYFDPATLSHTLLHQERARLRRLWAEFFEYWPLIVGPTWTGLPFEHDADLGPGGLELTSDRLRFISPANALALPALAMPTHIVDGQPMGVQLLAGQWREDICLAAAQIVEARLGTFTPIDPRS